MDTAANALGLVVEILEVSQSSCCSLGSLLCNGVVELASFGYTYSRQWLFEGDGRRRDSQSCLSNSGGGTTRSSSFFSTSFSLPLDTFFPFAATAGDSGSGTSTSTLTLLAFSLSGLGFVILALLTPSIYPAGSVTVARVARALTGLSACASGMGDFLGFDSGARDTRVDAIGPRLNVRFVPLGRPLPRAGLDG